ncbi:MULTISPECIES: helix-turn-helix transcriptional regulator [unclassified Pseudomonas]|uniref:helix-turn-helix transcriptional regulator n=1 Tax=unclassified Pseudomonas TaxID=196821 RepID=UPI000CD15820|nr:MULTISPECIES: helix-turn-helix transcriptional regulator [unclassified Pseudomonas]POA52234.1 helix-turn-helix transcriptional regulator [Pseudomonas sp. FW507-12TSA]
MSRSQPPAPGRLQAFSELVLALQQLAQNKDIEHLHQHALARIARLLPFDSAWWGRSALVNGVPDEHSCYLYRLPPSYLPDWQSIRHVDVTVSRVHQVPGRSVIVDMAAPDNGAGLNWLGRLYNIGELLCVVHIDPHTHLSSHLALYRQPGAARFTAHDRELLDNLMLHLVAAVSANQIRTLVATREQLTRPRNLALAVCDQRGVLHCAESGFVELLLNEWPHWSGPQLPQSLELGNYEGKCLQVESQAVGDLFLLAARSRTLLPQLSPRENEVAQSFGDGKTYKEVARDLGMSPNTVRHHIRAIYSKLGVKDKARIAQLLHAPPD